MYLESWIHNIIKNTFAENAAYRRFAGVDAVAKVTRSDVKTYQAFKLQQILHFCGEKSSFYREMFREASIRPDDIRDAADLGKLPFTEPHHIAEEPYRFLCTSQAEVARPYTFITSGTTGPKKRIFWTQGDLDRITDFMGAGIGTVADVGDTVLILLPNGRPNSQADLLYKGVKKLGAIPVVANIDLDAQGFLKAIEQSHCTVVFAYTRRLFRLFKELQLQCDLTGKRVKVLFLASEYLPDAMRQDLKRAWDCEVRTHYGLTEMGLGVAIECEAANGYHFNEADLLLEIVDPRTGKLVDEGEEGELVFTTLNREAMPLIRYRTHDLSRFMPEPCPCGATSLLRIATIRKRLENMIILEDGDTVYPTLFDDLLFEIPELVDYQVIVTREDGKDRLDFRIELITDGKEVSEIANKLMTAQIIAKNVAAGNMAPPRIEFVEPGSLRSINRAKKMILDRR